MDCHHEYLDSVDIDVVFGVRYYWASIHGLEVGFKLLPDRGLLDRDEEICEGEKETVGTKQKLSLSTVAGEADAMVAWVVLISVS